MVFKAPPTWGRFGGEAFNKCALYFFTLFFFAPFPAEAHAFGQRYDLPLPLWMFIWGGAAAVFLSFIVMALFVRHNPPPGIYPRYNLLKNPLGRLLAHPMTTSLVRLVFTALFVLIIATGFWGHQSPLKNLTIVMVWVIAWVGLAFICALLGNFWALINPWNALFSYAESAKRKLFGGDLSFNATYPSALGHWPAFIFFLAFAWLEINWSGASSPSKVATVLTVYSLITFMGMLIYGRTTWLKYGECFSVVYSLFARFAITEIRVPNENEPEKFEWNLRPPGIGLRFGSIADEKPTFTLMIFALLLLSTVTYDGFTETGMFKQVALNYYYFIQEVTGGGLGSAGISLVDTSGLISFPLMFVGVYLLFIWQIALIGNDLRSFKNLAPLLVLSIVPISIAYHLSHYISLLAIEGQLVIKLLSDPFGYGWDLFGTASYKTDIALINAKFVWFFSVILIVIGHIVAVYIAHAEALNYYGERRRALLSQIPMIVLMVGYTMLSLWIIAQPIVS
ncbi:MAG: hypothetical protein HN731_14845 [Rhodospirillaceae bacterium]|nr:hypothetical protein [Rhodospirillaceae bacterium]